MIENFNHRSGSIEDSVNVARVTSVGNLTPFERRRLEKIQEAWDFYEGYHWEKIPDLDSPQVTLNYCRVFVNKFVSFEFGKGFTINMPRYLESVPVTVNDTKISVDIDRDKDGVVEKDERGIERREKTAVEFLDEVWDKNNRDVLITELGQTKSITGDAWVKVRFVSPEDLHDPLEEFPNGRIRLSVIPTQYIFPSFNDHDKDEIEEIMVMYPIRSKKTTGILFKREITTTVMYKEIWTLDEIVTYEDNTETDRMPNPYGFLPFVQIKNFPIAGRTYGAGDLDDVIPLNMELNAKKSDISEIIDYHAAPITLVYGAKIGNLEKGANKVWGGLPKDSKVENLGLQGDLVASEAYNRDIKTSMCEIGGVPETVLGGAQAISNTSGVALQYMNLPMVERVNTKRNCTKEGLEKVNKYILMVALQEGLIVKPEDVSMTNFLTNSVEMPDTLPKDVLLELQEIQLEMQHGLECRHGALERLGVKDIDNKMAEIDRERDEHPELFNPALQTIEMQNEMNNEPQLNSGMTNGQTPIEQVRTEITGQNGGGSI